MASGQIHIAILNPGVEITPLRLRGWLQKEAAVINNRANPGDGAILRLFLTKTLRYGLPGKKLDAILQALTEKYPAVLRIEVQLIDAPLTADEMAEQTRIANADLQKFMQRAEEYAKRKQAEVLENTQPAPIQWHSLKKRAGLSEWKRDGKPTEGGNACPPIGEPKGPGSNISDRPD